jgi:hypothetical protein
VILLCSGLYIKHSSLLLESKVIYKIVLVILDRKRDPNSLYKGKTKFRNTGHINTIRRKVYTFNI